MLKPTNSLQRMVPDTFTAMHCARINEGITSTLEKRRNTLSKANCMMSMENSEPYTQSRVNPSTVAPRYPSSCRQRQNSAREDSGGTETRSSRRRTSENSGVVDPCCFFSCRGNETVVVVWRRPPWFLKGEQWFAPYVQHICVVKI